MKLPSSHIVVTGAAGGIGQALAHRFHAGGARLTLSDRDEAHLTEVCAELNALRPDSAVFFVADIGTQQGNLDLIAFARQSFGPIDLFFANAGLALAPTYFQNQQRGKTVSTSTCTRIVGLQKHSCPNGLNKEVGTSVPPHLQRVCSPKLVLAHTQ